AALGATVTSDWGAASGSGWNMWAAPMGTISDRLLNAPAHRELQGATTRYRRSTLNLSAGCECPRAFSSDLPREAQLVIRATAAAVSPSAGPIHRYSSLASTAAPVVSPRSRAPLAWCAVRIRAAP